MVPNRFVILHHLAPTGEHWDLMLEREDCLTTWQLLTEPDGGASGPIDCVRINDHRKFYLDYEGPVRGGRGIVSRIDHGTYRCLNAETDSLTIVFQGRRLSGEFRLVRPDPGSQSRWTLLAT